MAYQLDDYKKQALNIYGLLTADPPPTYPPNFLNANNYWRQGNVFDTLTDFLLLAVGQNMIAETDAQSFVGKALNTYNGLNTPAPVGNTGCWYDDFGWWGIASAKAYTNEYSQIFGEHAIDFQNIALSCWEIMKNGKWDGVHFGAPNVWATCDQTVFASVEPLFDGGVWQYDIFNDKRDNSCECSGSNPCTPIDLPPGNNHPEYPAAILGPFQLTVVNGLYLVLGLRLAAACQIADDSPEEVYGFLKSWCFDSGVPDDQKLLNTLGPDKGLIRERVSTYKNGGQVYWWDNQTPLSSDTSWGGDQGLFIGAMVDYLMKKPDTQHAQNLVVWILAGVPDVMKKENVMWPCYPVEYNKLMSADAGDYSSGAGVFMRYLLYAYQRNSAVQKSVDTENSSIRNLLFSSADACVNNSFPTFGNTLFDNFNQLATLTTAIAVLLKQGKTTP